MGAFFGPPGKKGNQIIPPHQRATDNREIAVHQPLEIGSYPRMKGSHNIIRSRKEISSQLLWGSTILLMFTPK